MTAIPPPDPRLVHDSFVIERFYPAPPARVFRAFADRGAKAQWFGCVEGWEVVEHRMDFRAGGTEVWRGGPPGGVIHRNDTTYHDIVRDQRIIWSYAMSLDGRCISASLATLQLRAAGTGTTLVLSETGVFLDHDADCTQRVRGTHDLLASLERYLSAGEPRREP
ncbi:SRPBCC family protein [Longimicrobium terrae]|uniref:Uncharacterized protein YndB with AHSA1/START domain n=1 Tax=Longimicrobium terrae TaxID=1639882 RepID=A0A841GRI5_9BACT|nr:SRPBCC family protein [Longimicrobium terrae]MBB4634231.1 uncharacterized protein YndB with AHSA1/START domain [Longimicrobium terrae]MBB6068879.1 uncharacterized protein YndB with AHSA1/START domain [Longimicrobium terrae]NNC28059.1 polyketide cyclase [Longimicrobium terrae]